MSTDNPEVETAQEAAPEAVVQENQEPEKLDIPESETPESEESVAKDDEEAALYVEIDGKEHNLEDVRTWRDGHLMQSDYTKKTQALAEERKSFNAERESERENLLQTKAEVTEMQDMLKVLVQEDEAIDWITLKDDDPDEYIRLKEKADARKAALEKVKAEVPQDDPALIQEEQSKLFAANPTWFDKENQPTDVYKSDVALMNKWMADTGYTAEEVKGMTRARYLITVLKAAKYDELQEKGRKINTKREKVPIVTKPKADTKKETDQPLSNGSVFFPNAKAG